MYIVVHKSDNGILNMVRTYNPSYMVETMCNLKEQGFTPKVIDLRELMDMEDHGIEALLECGDVVMINDIYYPTDEVPTERSL